MIDIPIRSQRWLFASLCIGSLLSLAGMLILQYTKQVLPCPLCIVQRYAYLLLALWAMFGWVSLSVRYTGLRRKLVISFEILFLITALAGMVAAGRQWWIAKEHAASLHCSFDALQPIMNDLLPAIRLPFAFKAISTCESADFPLLGLSLAVWSFLTLFFMLACVLCKIGVQRASARR